MATGSGFLLSGSTVSGCDFAVSDGCADAACGSAHALMLFVFKFLILTFLLFKLDATSFAGWVLVTLLAALLVGCWLLSVVSIPFYKGNYAYFVG